MSYVPKIDIRFPCSYPGHRSGWKYAVNSLRPLHTPDGILLDDCFDRKFSWSSPVLFAAKHAVSMRDPIGAFQIAFLTYKEGWIGFLHDPPIAHPFQNIKNLSNSVDSSCWQKNIKTCLGLFTLSTYLKDWLSHRCNVPIQALIHPTETPTSFFCPNKFANAPQRQLVQIGWYYRCLRSIYDIPTRTYKKIWLMPKNNRSRRIIKELIEKEYGNDCLPQLSSVESPEFLSNDDYDSLLTSSLVFIHLYDSSANNAIIECIVRNTPILVNPLPAVKEYLGEEYPLYFETLREAAAKAEDIDLVLQAHEYLKNLPIKQKLTGEYFLKSFAESEIYQSLPEVS